jgi:hypothetical protein
MNPIRTTHRLLGALGDMVFLVRAGLLLLHADFTTE